LAKKAALSTAWLTAGLHKWQAQASTIVCFETEDRARCRQLLHFLLQEERFTRHQIYSYDRWQGLRRYERQRERFVLVGAEEISPRGATGFGEDCRDLGTALRQMDKVLQSQPTIFILQDLEARQEVELDARLNAALRSWSQDAALFAQGSVVFLLAAQAEAVVDQYTLGRVAVVPVDLSLDTERAYLIYLMAQELGLLEASLRQIGTLVRLTAGLNLQQLRTVLLESYHRTSTLEPRTIARLKGELIKQEEIVEILDPKGGFELVGGYTGVKDFVRQNIVQVLAEPERAAQYGVPLPRGLLLFGPPGTGKTLFAKAIAGETNLPFINFKTENLYSELLGGSGKNFAKAIAIAEKHAPAIVFIDEIDKFGRRRGESTDGASEETRRVYNQVLEWLGDPQRQSILVGTTNRPEDLDPALLRSGRLSYKIPFLYPDDEARRQILQIHFGLTGLYPTLPVQSAAILAQAIEMLVAKTRAFSGAELEDLTHRVRRRAFQRQAAYVEPEDFQDALANFTIDLDARRREIAQYIQSARAFGNDASLLSAWQD